MKRGMLNTNAIPVARICVGKSSGSHTGIQVYWPRLKKALIAATTSSSAGSCTQRNSTGVSTSAMAKHRHLRHPRRAAAADQAAVDEQHPAAATRRLDPRIHAGAARADD